MYLKLTTLAAALMLASGAVFAQSATPPAAKPDTGPVTNFMERQVQGETLAGDLINQNVRNNADEKVGDINDLIIDKDGKVTGAVIGVGGFLGMGEKWVAVPYDAIKVTTDKDGNHLLTLNTTKEALNSAPAYKTLGPTLSERAKKAYGTAKEKTKEAYEATKEKAKDTYEAAKDKVTGDKAPSPR